jgi:DNA-binding LytR/AlgR family response regulator
MQYAFFTKGGKRSMWKAAIVEDDKNASDALTIHLKRYEDETGKQFRLFVFERALELLYDYTTDYDVIFMDIDLPTMNGMNAAEEIRKVDAEVPIVFVTNMAQYAIQGYSVNALDFLLKPVTYFSVKSLMDKVVRRKESSISSFSNIKTANGMRRIPYDSIFYIEVWDHRLYYHTADGDFVAWGSIGKAESELLPFDEFFRCNSGTIVNMNYIKAVEGENLQIAEQTVKISRPRRKEFMNRFAQWIGQKQ